MDILERQRKLQLDISNDNPSHWSKADCLLRFSAIAVRLFDLQPVCVTHLGSPVLAATSIFTSLLEHTGISSENELGEHVRQQRNQVVTRLCEILLRRDEVIAQDHLLTAARHLIGLVDSLKATTDEYLFLRSHLKPFFEAPLATAIEDGYAQSVFNDLPGRFGASGEETQARFREIITELGRAVDVDREPIGQLVSPLIRNLPLGVQPISGHPLSGSRILAAIKRGDLQADFRMAAVSNAWFADAVGRLATATNLIPSANSIYSPTHAAVVLILSRPHEPEASTAALTIGLPLRDPWSLARALLALAAFEPVVSLPGDANSAEASGQLADQVQSWKSQLRDCARNVSEQQERVNEAETALRARNVELARARRPQDELTRGHKLLVDRLDAYLKGHARELAIGRWSPEFQVPAYHLCRALGYRLPWGLSLPSDQHRTIFRRFVARALRTIPPLRKRSPSEATRVLRKEVIAAGERIPDVNIRALLLDIVRSKTEADQSIRHLKQVEDTQSRAQRAVDSARSILADAEAQRTGLENAYEGLFHCGRGDCL